MHKLIDKICHFINWVLKSSIIFIIALYKYFISPLLPKSCRFYPTCSEYAKEALVQRGIIHGIILALNRIIRCNPFCQGGYDPVSKQDK